MEHVGREKSRGLPGGTRAALVSVIIAAFNAEGSIEETCVSALQQTYTSLEVIVVDDGSTDQTGNIVRALAAADPRVRLIRQENLGVAAARNRAIAAATGEFIAPLDADDLWTHTKIERQVRHLQECGEDTGMVYCWWAWIDATATVLDRSPRWQIEGRVLDRLVEVNFTGSASVPLYRRSCFEELGDYSVNFRAQGSQGCEDWDLALRVAERYEIAVVPAILIGYRRRIHSMSAERETMWRSHAQIMAGLAARQASVSPTALRRSRGQFAMYLAGVALRSGNFLEACRWGLRARSLTLGLAVLPHVARMFARRLLRIGPSTPTLFSRNGQFDEGSFPEPLIPYDRIYARRWRGHEREAPPRP